MSISTYSQGGSQLKKAIGKVLELDLDRSDDHQFKKIVDKVLESLYIKKALAKSKTKLSCRLCRGGKSGWTSDFEPAYA